MTVLISSALVFLPILFSICELWTNAASEAVSGSDCSFESTSLLAFASAAIFSLDATHLSAVCCVVFLHHARRRRRVVVVCRPSARLNPKLIWNYQHQHPHCLNKEKKPTSTMSRPSPSTSPSPGPAATNGGATRQSLGPSVRPPPGAGPLSPIPWPQGSTVGPTSKLLGNSTSF